MRSKIHSEPATSPRRIGLLTSGGDCAGLNAAIRAVVLHATGTYGWEVVGIRNGTAGLLVRPAALDHLTMASVAQGQFRQGGTMLGTTNKGDPFAYPMPDGTIRDRSQEIAEALRDAGIDTVIGIGGDGSLAILRRLAQQGGFSLVGIPKTIDNDVSETEVSLGFDTAVQTATEALDRLQPTAASHNRIMVLEVMGRDAGHIALAAGIAGGADVILIPEIPHDLALVARWISTLQAEGKGFALVIVAEAVRDEHGVAAEVVHGGGTVTYGGIGHTIAARLSAETGADARVTVLGHVQRGGEPSPRDRLIAAAFGVHAVDLIAAGRSDVMVAWQNREAVSVPLGDAIRMPKVVDVQGPLVRTARGLGICLGDRERGR